MCGIAGYAGTHELGDDTLAGCLEQMRHRGPDAAGVRRSRTRHGRNVVLLSTRLDIVDLHERSNQPFVRGPTVLSYNGELYNYLELRAELERAGHEFTTTSDTEVLAAVLAERGAEALDECEGMWAFAHYDERDERLLLSRDRFGEKPLYIHRDSTGLYWGSEPKFVLALLGRRLEPNLDQLYRYLVNGYKALYKRPQTFFRGLEELPAASVLEVGPDGSERASAYWTPATAVDDGMEREDAVAAVRERVVRAVELRLRADVPLAFMMSGGVDSLSLIATAKRVLGYDVHGFTILTEDERYEERDMVDYAVRELGVRHTAVATDTTDFLARLRLLVRHHDAPVYTVSYYAQWLLLAAVADHGYRVSVSGTGADELFTGYYDHHLAYLYEVREEAALHAASVAAWNAHVRPHVRNPYLTNPDLFVADPGQRAHIFLDADRFAGMLRNGWREEFDENEYTASLLRNRMLNELLVEAVPVILHEDDVNSMYYSIENRSPYLDRDLYELSSRIPTRHLVRDGYAKSVLRDAMRGIVPDRVLDTHRKVGFNAPLLDFLRTRDPETREELLADSPIFEHVRREAVEELLDRESLPNSESKFLFNFVNAKMFLEELS